MIQKGLTAAFIVMVVAGAVAFASGKFFGSLENTLTFQTQVPVISLAESSSALRASYFTGEAADLPNRLLSALFITDMELTDTGFGIQGISSIPFSYRVRQSTLSVSVYYKQDLVVEWPVGTWGLVSAVAFSVQSAAMTYWWSELNVTAYGVAVTATFAVAAIGGEYGTGLEIEFVGTTLGGMGVTVATVFGIDTDFEELLLVQTESGSCGTMPYTSTEVNLTGLSLGCVHFETTVSFSATSGLDYAEFEFEIEPEDWVLSTDGTVTYAIQTKTLVLDTAFYLEPVCLDVYAALDPFRLGTEGTTLIDGFVIQGLGMRDGEIGNATFSCLVSFVGGLYRQLGDTDIDLRAADYRVDISTLAAKDQRRYVRLDYDSVFSVERGVGNLDFAADAYFRRNGTGPLFGLGLLTLDAYYRLSGSVEFGGGLGVDLVTGLQRLVLKFNCYLFQHRE